jgi:hypothetical protein
MNRFIEERAEALRVALRIPAFPDDEDTERAAEYLSASVSVSHAPHAKSVTIQGDQARTILLPAHLRGRARDLVLCEEIGHLLLASGLSSYLRLCGGQSRLQRLARLAEAKDEWLARQFVMAWFLPAWLVQLHDDPALGDASGCDPEMVRERRRLLAGYWLDMSTPPHWCAAREYVIFQYTHPIPCLHLMPRDLSLPQFAFANNSDAALQAVKADLIALTHHEFALKHRNSIPKGPIRIEVGPADMLALPPLVMVGIAQVA